MPTRFDDFNPNPFPYEDKLNELLGNRPQWNMNQGQMQEHAQRQAGLQIDPQVQALTNWKQKQAGTDLESAISRGGGRSGAVDWLANQRQERFGGELQNLEARRGDITAQTLNQLESLRYDRGQQDWQAQQAALSQLSQMSQAYNEEQWRRALDVSDRTTLTPSQIHDLNIRYGDLIGEIPQHLLDMYGNFAADNPLGGTQTQSGQQPSAAYTPTFTPTPTPTSSNTGTTASSTLARGSSGASVSSLQQTLTGLGFNTKGVDGKFGPATEAAVKAFQRAAGITVDGRVGPQTIAALQNYRPTTTATTSSVQPGSAAHRAFAGF